MWKEENNALYKKFQFSDFVQAFSFMTRVAIIAEKVDHHPTWKNTWNTVEIWLSTHDAGNIVTEKDHNLASAIDGVVDTK
jgi:4a-hydroxytetrahydrobiopterin dehydratase